MSRALARDLTDDFLSTTPSPDAPWWRSRVLWPPLSVPSRYQISQGTEVWRTKALHVVEDVVAGGTKERVVIEGSVGSGKTFALYYAESLLVAEGACERIAFLNFGDFISRVLDRKRRRKTLEALCEADVTIVDDVGASHVSKMPIGLFEEVVSHRDAADYMLLISTNLRPAEFRQTFGPRTYDRLRGNGAWYNVSGPSLRGRSKAQSA